MEPAFGVGSCFCIVGGVSFVSPSPGARVCVGCSAVTSAVTGAVGVFGAGVVVQNPNHDEEAGASSLSSDVGVLDGVVGAGGVFVC